MKALKLQCAPYIGCPCLFHSYAIMMIRHFTSLIARFYFICLAKVIVSKRNSTYSLFKEVNGFHFKQLYHTPYTSIVY